jgi:tRNA nucleotidyltransferase (CCA-adding enzyme)
VVEAGGRAYLVGGSVRDALLGRTSKDLDVEVFGLPVDRLEGLLRRLGRVNAVGRSFGVLKWRPRADRTLGELDVSIPRRDSNVGPGHKGIDVEGDPDMSLDEAVRRRDLTINAILFDIDRGELVDPSGGQRDLEAGLLRAVDTTTFLEDPLRALRVVQFAARLGFQPDEALVQLCIDAALDELPAERIQGEWQKLLLKGEHLSLGMELAARTRVLARVFPGWSDPTSGPLLDALRTARDRIAHRSDDPKAEGRAWALMLTGWLAHASKDQVEDVLDRLWLHKVAGYPLRERVHSAVAQLGHPLDSDAALRRLSTVAEVETVASVRAAQGDPHGAHALAAAERLGVLHHKPPPLLQGRDIKTLMKPGPEMGRLLAKVYEAQLDGDVRTPEEALALAQTLGPHP